MTDWQPPRCIHGHILLGCPHDDCPTQTAYLDQQAALVQEHEHRQSQNARDLVRGSLGLPLDTYECPDHGPYNGPRDYFDTTTSPYTLSGLMFTTDASGKRHYI